MDMSNQCYSESRERRDQWGWALHRRMMTSEAARPTSAECLEDPFFKTMEDIGRGEAWE